MQVRPMIQALLASAVILSPAPLLAQNIAGAYLAARHSSLMSDYEDGARYFAEAIARDPGNADLLERALVTMIAKGDLEETTRIAVLLEETGSQSRFAMLAGTALAIERGAFDAIPEPDMTQAGLEPLFYSLARAWGFLGQGQMQEAEAALETLAEVGNFAPLARYHHGLVRAAAGDFEAADAILSGTRYGPLTLTPRGIAAHAQVLVQLDRAADARDLLDQARAQRADASLAALASKIAADEPMPYDFVTNAAEGVAEVYFEMAQILHGRADAERVLFHARLAQRLRPDHARAILIASEALEDLEQFNLAVRTYAQIPEEDPAYLLAELGRANALYRGERKDAAIEVLNALGKLRPDEVMVYAALGDMLSQERRDDEAIAAYARALELRDADAFGNWTIHYRRGIIHERQGDLVEMERDFRRALELSPDQPDVLNYLGYSLVEQRAKLDEALGMIERAVELRPQSGYITDSLGWVYYRLGRFEDAVEPMERAVELLPVDPIVNDHLGDVYWIVGRHREAEFQWKRALSFEPEETEADRIRRKLEVGLDKVLEEETAIGQTETAQD